MLFRSAPALDLAGALSQAEGWGCAGAEPLREREAEHIFTHVQWEMRVFTLRCREAPPCFTWVTPAQLEAEYALPSAFRKLL